MNGYVISMYNEKWWLSYVLGENEVKVTFLHPSEPSPSFSYPLTLDVLWIPSSDIIYKVNSITPTGRMNILPIEKKEKDYRDYESLLIPNICTNLNVNPVLVIQVIGKKI
ncbi:hypothetical protein AVEN_117305-1 [Araneus ventricosus]|uniref:Uncharacterized protein n=1 Tax=Araneus ventricosus TaxID=182803 RepID=A0A4Y2WGY7_ARAVE|nr:hypothetical protein AVEN_117305-1 [Araneus ventricosus]